MMFHFLQVVHTEIDGHTDDEQDCSDDSIHGTYSDNDIDMNPKDPEENVYSPENFVQVTLYLSSTYLYVILCYCSYEM
jgi:hypothetical protein